MTQLRFPAPLRLLLTTLGLLAVLTGLPFWSAFGGTDESCARVLQIRGSSAPAMRSSDQISELVVMTYNVKNLFKMVGDFDRFEPNNYRQTGDAKDKPLSEMQGVAQAILDSSPDLIVLQEIEGLQTLEDFNKQFLNSGYTAVLHPGNDARGIEIGFLIKKDLPLQVALESHRDVRWNDPADNNRSVPLFSRDLPSLLFFRQSDDPKTATPLFVMIGNHGKSKRDRPGDPNSNLLRAAQYREARVIVDGYQKKYGNDLPILLAGDFNTDVKNSPELQPLREKMQDVLDLVEATGASRITHTYHPHEGGPQMAQLDGILVNQRLALSVLAAAIYRYKDQNGVVKPIPQTYQEREKNPSDHFPIVLRLSTKLIFPEAHPAKPTSSVVSPLLFRRTA